MKLEDGFLLVMSFSRFSFRVCCLEGFPISVVELFEAVAREASGNFARGCIPRRVIRGVRIRVLK